MYYPEATSFFLNALSLNPKATHIWSYLESCFICTKNEDAIRKAEAMDPSQFPEAHNVHGPADLPPPEGIDYITSFENNVLKEPLDAYVQQASAPAPEQTN